MFTVLADLFNESLASGVFPDQWKSAVVKPLAKCKDPSQPSDFRPISLLPALSKVLERVVFLQVMDYCTQHHLLDSRQTAYRQGFSTNSAILRLLDDIRRGTDSGLVTVALFLDLSKAFDSVDHAKLLHKLGTLGFDDNSINWFRSYLSQRRQHVVVNHDSSSSRPTDTGVPQGSVLGPLLFLLYTFDLATFLRFCSHISYADDTVIYLTCLSSFICQTFAQLNEDVAEIVKWGAQNGIKINATKSAVMLFGGFINISLLRSAGLPVITINGQPVPLVESFKYLGVQLDGVLSWGEQVSATCAKVFSALHRLRRNSRLFSQELRRKLAVALLLPLFDYGTMAMTDISDGLQLKLQRAFNAVVRFVVRVSRFEHISPYRRSCGWMKLSNRRKYLSLCWLHNAIYAGYVGLHPDILDFTPPRQFRDNEGRTDTLTLQACRTPFSAFQRSFTVKTAAFWNALPSRITTIEDLNVFKIELYHFFMNQEAAEARRSSASDLVDF